MIQELPCGFNVLNLRLLPLLDSSALLTLQRYPHTCPTPCHLTPSEMIPAALNPRKTVLTANQKPLPGDGGPMAGYEIRSLILTMPEKET